MIEKDIPIKEYDVVEMYGLYDVKRATAIYDKFGDGISFIGKDRSSIFIHGTADYSNIKVIGNISNDEEAKKECQKLIDEFDKAISKLD